MQNHDELMKELERLQAENTELRAKRMVKPTLKVSEKGGVSLYGCGRFPVSLYRSQWEIVLAQAENIRAFIDANADRLTTKTPKE